MQINEILDDLSRDALIELFGLPSVIAVEASLSEKNAKPYVECLVEKRGSECTFQKPKPKPKPGSECSFVRKSTLTPVFRSVTRVLQRCRALG